jgi:hypothetical protein
MKLKTNSLGHAYSSPVCPVTAVVYAALSPAVRGVVLVRPIERWALMGIQYHRSFEGG